MQARPFARAGLRRLPSPHDGDEIRTIRWGKPYGEIPRKRKMAYVSSWLIKPQAYSAT